METADIAVFVEAVNTGSLAAAARRLGIGAMAASRRLAALESELGVRLVHRTTRSLAPTADGETFLPHAQAMLEQRAGALAALRPVAAGLSGQLRITASTAFGRKIVAPMMATFMRANPTLHVDLLMTDEQVDIVAQGIDVAVRIAKLRDNRLVARRLADSGRRLCASPGYLAEHGVPATLADIAAHACLSGTGVSHWSFVREGRITRHKVGGRFSASSIEALHRACLDGLGIANLSSWYVAEDIAQGRLEEICLADACPEPLSIWAVYPTARMMPAKVRAFIDALDKAIEHVPSR